MQKYKKYSKFFAILLAVAMVLPGVMQAAPVDAAEEVENVMRLGGDSRVGTALEASKEAYPDKADAVVIAGSGAEVDALAGTLLADYKDAPLLLSGKKELRKDVLAKIKDLGAKEVYILGGEKAVPKKVATQLKNLKVTRVDGKNRNETAVKVAKLVKGNSVDKIFLASGADYNLSDALSIGPVSAMKGMPILLSNGKSLPKTTMDAMKALGVKEVVVIGGVKAVSKNVVKELGDKYKERVAGDRREDTALEIANKYFTDPEKAVIANGYRIPDALVGGYLGAMHNAPILLTNVNSISENTITFLKDNISFAYVLGGEKVVSVKVFDRIVEVLHLEDETDLTITILATTDIHGNIYNWSYEDGEETNNTGMTKVNTIVEQVRKENPNTILLDAGDLIQGTILTDEIYSRDLTQINPMIDVLNYMDYDAMVLGNHEFNFGVPVVDKLMKDAEFPVLAANIYNKADDSNYAQPYTIVERSGVKIGVLGLTTPNIPRWDGAKVEDLEFRGMNEAAAKHIEELKEEGVDLIVTVSHAGLDQEYQEGDEMTSVIEENPEIDAAIVGHAHSSVSETIGTTVVGGARSEGNEVIRFDIDLKEGKDEWEVLDRKVKLIEVDEYEASEDLKEYAKEYHETTLEFISEELGTATGDFSPKSEIKGIPEAQIRDTAVMDLINDIQLEDSGADVSAAALFSSSSNIEEGTITYADIFDIYKFPNTLVMLEVSGQELMDYMEWSVKYYNTYKEGDINISFNPDVRAYLYDMFQGVDYKIDLSKPAGERITDLVFDGEEVQVDDTLKLVVNDYRYSGLMNEGIISGEPIYQSAPVSSRELIAQHIDKLGTIDPDVDNNWEIIGADLDHVLRDYIIGEVNEGNIELPKSDDGRTPNVKALNVYELIKDGKIPADVLEEHGLDSEGNPK